MIRLNLACALSPAIAQGYDSIGCRQQKCWAHLIRVLNDDLWRSPFDTEFETFILNLRNLILPIFETLEDYGLKKKKSGEV